MQLFECQACGQPLYFENVVCGSCGRRLGYLPEKTTITALEPDGEQYKALADPEGRYFTCANLVYESCNWLIPADSGDTYCGHVDTIELFRTCLTSAISFCGDV